jgi:hypothetical protein
MTTLVIGVIFSSLFIITCFKNFFIQIISIKLLIDAMVLILVSSRGIAQSPFNTQSTAVIVAGLGLLVFFILMSSAILMFSKKENVGLKVENE